MGKLTSRFLERYRRIVLSTPEQARQLTQESDPTECLCVGHHYSVEEFKTDILDRCKTREEKQGIRLRGCCLHGEDLSGLGRLEAIPFDGCNLRKTIMIKLAFPGCTFDECDLRDADLLDADLTGVSLNAADLRGATLEGAKLAGAKMYEAKLMGTNLRGVQLDRTRIQRESLGSYIAEEKKGKDHLASAHDIYLRLKENFKSIGAYDAASWAYIRERIIERRSYAPWSVNAVYGKQYGLLNSSPTTKLRFYIKYTLKYLGAWFQELAWGYGQKPERVAIICTVVVLGFAMIFSVIGGVSKEGMMAPSFGDLLIYSLASFALSSVPNVEPVTPLAQVFTSLEGILGVATLALFTTALAQRMGQG